MINAKRLLLLILILAESIQVKADTIDYWHVNYNNKKISAFDLNSTKKLVSLKLDKVKNTDIITIKYFRDTPCSDCMTSIIIEDDENKKINVIKGKGTFFPISFPMQSILNSHKTRFKVYFYENGRSDRIYLFTINLQ